MRGSRRPAGPPERLVFRTHAAGTDRLLSELNDLHEASNAAAAVAHFESLERLATPALLSQHYSTDTTEELNGKDLILHMVFDAVEKFSACKEVEQAAECLFRSLFGEDWENQAVASRKARFADMRLHVEDIELQMEGMMQIVSMVRAGEEGRKLAVQLGGIGIVEAAMRAHPADAQLQQLGTELLRRLRRIDLGAHEAAAITGVLDKLRGIVDSSASSVWQLRPGLLELCALLKAGHAAAEHALDAGAADIMVAAMKMHASIVAVQTVACTVISMLYMEARGAPASTDIVDQLLATLRTCCDVSEVQHSGFIALGNVVIHDSALQQYAAGAGVVELIVAALSSSTTGDSTLEAACSLLRGLVNSHASICETVADHAADAVFTALLKRPSSAKLQLCGIQTLFFVLQDSPTFSSSPLSCSRFTDVIAVALQTHPSVKPLVGTCLRALQDMLVPQDAPVNAAADRALLVLVQAATNAHTHEMGCSLLQRILAKPRGLEAAISRAGVLDVIVAALQSPADEASMAAYIRILAAMCDSGGDSCRAKALEAGAVQAAVHALRFVPDDASAAAAFSIIAKLAALPAARVHLLECGADAIAAVAATMDRLEGDATVQCHGCVTMTFLVQGAGITNADKTLAVDAATKTLLSHPHNEQLQELGCLALGSICHTHLWLDSSRSQLMIYAAVTATLRFYTNRNVLDTTTDVLAIVITGDESCNCAVSANAVEALMYVLRSNCGSYTQSTARRVLVQLVRSCKAAVARACECGALQVLMQSLRTVTLDDKVREDSYRLLFVLCEADVGCADKAIKAGVLQLCRTKDDGPQRTRLHNLLRQHHEAALSAAMAAADAAAAQLLAEVEAEAAAKLKRKAKKKTPRARAAAAAAELAADDDALPAAAPDADAADASAVAEPAASEAVEQGELAAAEEEAEAGEEPTLSAAATRRQRRNAGKIAKRTAGGADASSKPSAASAAAVEAAAGDDTDAATPGAAQPAGSLDTVEGEQAAEQSEPPAEEEALSLLLPRATPPRSRAKAKPAHRDRRRVEPPAVSPSPDDAADATDASHSSSPGTPPQMLDQGGAPSQPQRAREERAPEPAAREAAPPAAAAAEQRTPPARAKPLPEAAELGLGFVTEPLTPAAPLPPVALLPSPPMFASPPPPRRQPPPYRPPSGAPQGGPAAPAAPAAFSIFAEIDAQAAQQAASFASISGPAFAGASSSGLANATGEYNCFLNSIVQALFHVDCFRGMLRRAQLPVHPSMSASLRRSVALVRALKELFDALECGAALRRDATDAAAASASHQAVVDPTALRQALAELSPGGVGGLAAMADASEVMSTLYDAFLAVSSHYSPHMPAASTSIGRMFGFGVHERVECKTCDLVTHSLRYRTFFHIVPSTALRKLHARGGARTFEALLRAVQSGGDRKSCDTDAGGCGAAFPVLHTLDRPPQVFTISLSWPGAQADEDEVAATMKALHTSLRPEQVYRNPVAGEPARYELRGLIAFYGAHYAAFARTDSTIATPHAPATPSWTRFDDASVTCVGGWEAVCDACARGHLQPTLLFYEHVVLF